MATIVEEEDSVLDIDDVRDVLEDFVGELGERLDTHEVERVLTGEEDNLTSADLGSKPETFTENYLIFELLEAAGLTVEEQPYGQAGEHAVWPDFEILNIDPDTIGESKPLNNAEEGISEIKDYLDRKSIGAEYGIVTDGIEWYIFRIELGGDFTEYPEIRHINLRKAMIEIARDIGIVSSTSISQVDIDEELTEFVNTFDQPKLDVLLSQTAPRQLRDERKRDVEEFYELYIELLFGQSKEYDYDTCLMDDIRTPPGAPDHDQRLFAVTLMNRLLFIKFLESTGILQDGFLKNRVERYEAHQHVLAGNLYETQIKPTFYKLFNTELENRDPKHRDGWFAEVPYLNGGLFRENIPNESDYTVIDRMLPTIVSDLIEGSELDMNGRGFDPAIIGSVFEKTINHIEAERTKKDSGAYYTPNDVTDLVSDRAIDPKIREVLIETFVEIVPDDEDQAQIIRSQLEDKTLQEILEAVENGQTWYASPDALEEAEERLSNLKVVDPACGSGHFLTSAMDEIHRAQVSIMRGLNYGEDPDPEDLYKSKRELALRAIYGVDADEVATEIAKLRVWLKIVESNEWDPEYGKLPNIDVNITNGNSLVGLPVKGMASVSLGAADVQERIQDILDLRQKVKDEELEGREELKDLEVEVREDLNKSLLDQLNHTIETDFEERESFLEFANNVEENLIHRKLVSVRITREDGDALSDEELERLGDMGADWQEWRDRNVSVSIDIEEHEKDIRDEVDDPKSTITNQLADLLDDGFQFSAKRRPIRADLNDIFGRPFHWAAEFPEARPTEDSLSVEFDIIVGNPPYGENLQSESEEAITATYKTAGQDISALFVERQLQLLDSDGHFGNVTTLKLAYKAGMTTIQDIFREKLDTTTMSCFAKRPSKVFEGAEVRVAIITGRKDTDTDGNIETSEFIRFDNDEDRESRFRNISHRDIEGYILRKDGIDGDGSHIAIPKIGLEVIESILQKLKSQDTLFQDEEEDEETNHVIWRRRGMDNFTNPMIEKLYDGTDITPLYFDSELKARSAFLIISSSTYYAYWCAYGDMFHLNLGEIRAFPFPEEEQLEAHEDEIIELSDELKELMNTGFNPSNEEVENYEQHKPILDRADEIFGSMYGLSEEEIEFLQDYHSDYGRHGPDDTQLDDY